jgi:WD40 repeat protein
VGLHDKISDCDAVSPASLVCVSFAFDADIPSEGHTNNVSFACYHPELPIIISGSEDGTIRIWHANTYRFEQSLNYGLERAWCVAYQKGKQGIACGFDDGVVVVKLGREEPAVSIDASGKLIWAKNNEVVSAIIKGSGMLHFLAIPLRPLIYKQTHRSRITSRFPSRQRNWGLVKSIPKRLSTHPMEDLLPCAGMGRLTLSISNSSFVTWSGCLLN